MTGPATSRRMLGFALVLVAAFAVPGCSGEATGNDNDAGPGPQCGNGIQEPGEECDGQDLGDADCPSVSGQAEGALACTARCFFDVSGCHGCGDGVLEPGEECDGPALAGETCASLTGLHQGQLACGLDCAFDVGDCSECGDGVVEGSEACDGSNLAGATCQDLGYVAPARVACSPDCTLAPGDCYSRCGNGVTEPGEVCDGTDVGAATCEDAGYAEPGIPGCLPSCQELDYDRCQAVCGNGVVEPGETCDDGNHQLDDGCPDGPGGTCTLATCGDGVIWSAAGEECDRANLRGATCQALVGQPGPLRCLADCSLDVASCLLCGDGMVDPQEGCDGANLRGLDCHVLGFTTGSLTCLPECALDTGPCAGPRFYFYDTFDVAPMGRWTLSRDWLWGTENLAMLGAPLTGHALATSAPSSSFDAGGLGTPRTATSPAIALTGSTAPVLQFRSLWQPFSFDLGTVKVSTDGVTFTATTAVDPPHQMWIQGEGFWISDSGGMGSSWTLVTVDLAPYAGQTIWLQLDYRTEYPAELPVWLVDDVIVAEADGLPVRMESPAGLGAALVDAPWSAALGASGGSGSYVWSILGGSNHGWISLDPVTGTLDGTPDATALGPADLTVRVADAVDANNYAESTLTLTVVTPATLPYLESFDGPDPPPGWQLAGQWEWGTVLSGPYSTGPSACVAGACLGTNLAGSYAPGCDLGACWATSPPIDLANSSGAPYLEFQAYVETDYSDGGVLQISVDGVSFFDWPLVTPAYSLPPGDGGLLWGSMDPGLFPSCCQWYTYTADLAPLAGQVVFLRFAFQSVDTGVYGPWSGWYLDELAVYP